MRRARRIACAAEPVTRGVNHVERNRFSYVETHNVTQGCRSGVSARDSRARRRASVGKRSSARADHRCRHDVCSSCGRSHCATSDDRLLSRAVPCANRRAFGTGTKLLKRDERVSAMAQWRSPPRRGAIAIVAGHRARVGGCIGATTRAHRRRAGYGDGAHRDGRPGGEVGCPRRYGTRPSCVHAVAGQCTCSAAADRSLT